MIITNGKIITWEEPSQVLEKHAIRIADGLIAEIGPQDQLIAENPSLEQVDASGQYVMPGNICAHTHFYGAYARGLAIPGPAPKDFPEILQKLWWPLDKSLNMGDVRASAEVMLVDAIRNGTTTLFDHHASPNAIDGSLDEIADAVEKAGVRSVLCYEVTDRDGKGKAQAGIRENLRFQERLNAGDFPRSRVAATFGLHASLTLSEETLDDCRAAQSAEGGFHIHVAEHESDEYDSLEKSGLRVVDRLSKHEILGSKTIVAHVVHIDIKEARILADTGTWVTHQPRSNMNNAVGAAPIESLLRAGIKVGIGTDGFSHAMWEEWKTAYLLHKIWNRDPRRFTGMDAVQLGVYNNAALANKFFPQASLGQLTPGAAADIIFVDYHPHTPLTALNLPWQIIFGFNESMITTTIVAGEFLMKDRNLLTLDEERITFNARRRAPEVWARYNTFAPI